jgi:hypothetical protein
MEQALRKHDIFVLLVVHRQGQTEWTYESLSESLGIAKSETFRSLNRSACSHLFDKDSRRVRTAELLEFIAHGIRYAFPISPGGTARGMPTGWNAPGLEAHLVEDELERFVWPHPRGTMRGRAVEPLHDAVIACAAEDEVLHRQFALCDAIRLGGARERELAAKLLTEELRS